MCVVTESELLSISDLTNLSRLVIADHDKSLREVWGIILGYAYTKQTSRIGVSPNGKATGFGSVMCWFESNYP